MSKYLFALVFLALNAFAAETQDVKIGSYQVTLYPDTPALESNKISVSIEDRASPDACNGGAADAYYTLEQDGDCSVLSYHYSDGSVQDKSSYCKSDILKSADHSYKIKQVLSRCERFAESQEITQSDGEKVILPPNGGILHPHLYRYPLIRLVDEKGQIWVTDSNQIDYFVDLSRTHTVSETGSCKAKGAILGYGAARNCAAENAKNQAQQACSDLGQRITPDSLVEEKAPWMCYTEAFEEQFCATYSAHCE
jgi:hypothetical protein